MLNKTYSWWRDLLFNVKNSETELTLLEKINVDRVTNYAQSVLEKYYAIKKTKTHMR